MRYTTQILCVTACFIIMLLATPTIAVGANNIIPRSAVRFDETVHLYLDANKQPVTGVLVEYYPSGKIKEETPCVNGKREGIKKEYYPTGIIEEEVSYTAGVKNGLRKEYYKNGTLKDEVTYVNGEKDGLRKEYHKSGALKKQRTYSRGKKVE